MEFSVSGSSKKFSKKSKAPKFCLPTGQNVVIILLNS